MKPIVMTCLAGAAVMLAACAAPIPIYDPRTTGGKEDETGLSHKDFLLAQIECERLRDAHTRRIMFGNFGGWEGQRVLVRCMKERGFPAVNGHLFE